MNKNLFHKLLAGLVVCAMLFCSGAALADDDAHQATSSGASDTEVMSEAPADGEAGESDGDEAETPAEDEEETADETGSQTEASDAAASAGKGENNKGSLVPNHTCVFEAEPSYREPIATTEYWDYDEELHASWMVYELRYYCTVSGCNDYCLDYALSDDTFAIEAHDFDEEGICTVCGHGTPEDSGDSEEPADKCWDKHVPDFSSPDLKETSRVLYGYSRTTETPEETHYAIYSARYEGPCTTVGCETNYTWVFRTVYSEEYHALKNGKCACGYRTGSKETRYRIASRLVNEIQILEANGGEITIVGEDKVYTDAELASVKALAKTEERMFALLTALGLDSEVDYTLDELDITLSEEAQNLISEVKARVADSGVLPSASDVFPPTTEKINGVTRTANHITLTATYAKAPASTSTFCFYKDGKWYFNEVHAA